MIPGFARQTAPLTVDERLICDYLIRRLQFNRGAGGAATSGQIVKAVRKNISPTFTPARLRKIVNHIRRHDLLPGLVASSRGYYLEDDPAKIEAYILSLRGRAEAIAAVAEAMERDLKQLKFFDPYGSRQAPKTTQAPQDA